MIAALFVDRRGPYSGLPQVDPWPAERDARFYRGPHVVVAHPPCARWGAYANGAPMFPGRYIVGADNGCFASALTSVLLWGGVLEHPARSKAWPRFGLPAPDRDGGWLEIRPNLWTAHVEQGWYGHRARKATWLLVAGPRPLELHWGRAPGGFGGVDLGCRSREERRRKIRTGVCQQLSHRQRSLTPIPFRDLLLSIAAAA